jgi:anti-sigma factor RsiW
MIDPRDPITDADLDAYVDDQLDVCRRIEVEAHLSTHPDKASRVMLDLKTRDELRLALASFRGMARSDTNDAAGQLERGLVRRRLLGTLQRMAAVGLFIAAGWFAHLYIAPITVPSVNASSPPPAYVEDAVMAHRTTMVRASMKSQPEVTVYDSEEIRAATDIVIPGVPKDWRVTDFQVFPSKFGPNVDIALDTDDHGVLSLFAVRPGNFDVIPPTIAHGNETAAAYWQVGEVAYALVAKAEARNLDRAAARLANTLY